MQNTRWGVGGVGAGNESRVIGQCNSEALFQIFPRPVHTFLDHYFGTKMLAIEWFEIILLNEFLLHTVFLCKKIKIMQFGCCCY